jgi:hypothetical protein
MRRIACTLLVVVALAALAGAGSGCASGAAQAGASPATTRHLFTLIGFDLRAGHPYRVSFTVDAPKLRIIASVAGRGPAPGADPALAMQLERVDGSRLETVGLKAGGHAASRYWLYTAEATGLSPGLYRLTLTGDGTLRSFGAAQL